MRKLVTAVFAARHDAEVAADGLTHHGFTAADIGVLMTPAGRERFAIAGGVLGAAAAGLAALSSAAPEELTDEQILLGVAAPEEKVQAARDVLRIAGGKNVTVR
jgi:hypothetical protein